MKSACTAALPGPEPFEMASSASRAAAAASVAESVWARRNIAVSAGTSAGLAARAIACAALARTMKSLLDRRGRALATSSVSSSGAFAFHPWSAAATTRLSLSARNGCAPSSGNAIAAASAAIARSRQSFAAANGGSAFRSAALSVRASERSASRRIA